MLKVSQRNSSISRMKRKSCKISNGIDTQGTVCFGEAFWRALLASHCNNI